MTRDEEQKIRDISREEITRYIDNSLEKRVLDILNKTQKIDQKIEENQEGKNISVKVESQDIERLKEDRAKLEEEIALRIYSQLKGMVSEKNRKDIDAIIKETKNLVMKFYSENKKMKERINSLSGLENVKNENDNLVEKLDRANREIRDRDAKLQEKDGEIQKRDTKLQEKDREIRDRDSKILEKDREIRKYEMEKDGLKDLYRIKSFYDKYMEISYEVRAKLSKVIKSNNIGEFLASCYSMETMDNLWDFVSLHGRNRELNNIKDIKILAQIFEFFIAQENKKYNEDTYMVFAPRLNDCYDPHRHIDIDGNGEDIVTDILFPGYGWVEKNEENEKICTKINKPALVKTCSR